MKKNRTVRLAVLLLVLTLVTSCFVGGTFAKYTTTAQIEGSARVAKFDVTALVGKNTASDTINIFAESAVYDTKDVTDYTAAGVNDADIDDGSDEVIIAPGSWGVFSYGVTNNSEVTVEYTVDFTVNEAGVPLEWSVDGSTWTDDLADITTPITIDDDGDEAAVYWRWVFTEGSTDDEIAARDADDTALGTADNLATPTVTIDITFTQVD